MRSSFISAFAPAIARVTAMSCLGLGAVAGSATTAAGQQANASAAAVGMDNNYVARAKGLDAVAWNPAMLGLIGNPGFTFSALTFNGVSGLDPVSASDFLQFAKKDANVIPTATRESWLATVTSKGGENGHADVGLTEVGISMGHLAFQLSTSATMEATINPDAFQALMFGNAGATGSLQNLAFGGSNVRAAAFTTAALSYGLSLGNGGTRAAPSQSSIGITAKYILGNGVVMAQDNGSAITADSVEIQFPIVSTDPDSVKGGIPNSGTGVGIDVGYAWRSRTMALSISALNIYNTFKWDVTKLESRLGAASFDGTTNSANFDEAPYASAPQSLKDMIADYTFKPAIDAGLAYTVSHTMTVTADAHDQLGSNNSIIIGPKAQLGGGVEWRGIPLLALRAGASYVTGGYSVAGGVGLDIGSYELGVSGLIRHRDGGTENGILVSVFSFR